MTLVLQARIGQAGNFSGETWLRLVPRPVASPLAGLSTEKFREGSSARALVPVDGRPNRRGSPAKFSWQTHLGLDVWHAERTTIFAKIKRTRAALENAAAARILAPHLRVRTLAICLPAPFTPTVTPPPAITLYA